MKCDRVFCELERHLRRERRQRRRRRGDSILMAIAIRARKHEHVRWASAARDEAQGLYGQAVPHAYMPLPQFVGVQPEIVHIEPFASFSQRTIASAVPAMLIVQSA
jgi:hypothetical protein